VLDCHGVRPADRAGRVTEPASSCKWQHSAHVQGGGGGRRLWVVIISATFLYSMPRYRPATWVHRRIGRFGPAPNAAIEFEFTIVGWRCLGAAFCAGTTGLAKPAGERRVASRTETHRRCDQRRPKRRGTPRKTSLLAGPCARLVRALCPVRSCLRSCTPLHHAS
jgi:hypothetical protein